MLTLMLWAVQLKWCSSAKLYSLTDLELTVQMSHMSKDP